MKFFFLFLSVLLNVGELVASFSLSSTNAFHLEPPRSRIYFCHRMSQEHKTKFQSATTLSEVLSVFPDDILPFDLKQKCSKIFLDKTDEDNRPLNPLQNFRLDKYFGLFEGYAETLRGNCSDFRQIDQY